MAERLADIITQMQNVRQLGAVVTAMRGIAASRAQKGRSLLAGIDAYADVISHAIGQALALLPADATVADTARSAKRGLILFCAEQGFAGAFSERVFEAAGRDLREATALIVGTRGAMLAAERGITASWSAPMVTHVEAVSAFANRLAEALYGHVAGGNVKAVDIVYSRATPARGIAADRHSLLPIDFRRFTRPAASIPPLTTLSPEVLLQRLAAEYVYAQLCQAAMHAFEAENEARMVAMTGAKANVETKLDALAQRERQLRQEEITTEIVELATGAEALKRDSR
jgi:F-type H+-transporting ATPase subunit gamma